MTCIRGVKIHNFHTSTWTHTDNLMFFGFFSVQEDNPLASDPLVAIIEYDFYFSFLKNHGVLWKTNT